MKKLNWKFILPPPVLALFLFAACNLIQEMPQDFVETYGNIAYVEKVEYVNLAEENVGTPKVTETKNFKIIYHIKNDGDFDLSPEFSFEGCEIENPIVSTEKKRVTLTVAGESLKTLKDGAEFKVKLTLYKATQKVLQSAYEIDMRYVYTGGPDVPKGTVEIKIPLNLPDGYTLEVKDPENYFTYDKDKGIVTTIGSGVPEGKYELELVVKDDDGNEIVIKQEIEVSAGKPTTGFTEKDDEKPLGDIIKEIEDKIKEIEENKKNPETQLGKVEINIPVSGGYTLDIDDEAKKHFEIMPNENGSYTIKQNGDGLPEKEYELKLIVKEDGEEVKQFDKTIKVSADEVAKKFSDDDKPFKITAEMIEKTTVYVRGTGGWYDVKHPDDAKASNDNNSGARLEPFETIQRAINEIIARNAASADADEYTIYVDGTLTQDAAANANGMADFSALDKNLTLTIKAFPKTPKATLDAGGKSRVIYAQPKSSSKLNLTLENIAIMGGNASSSSGGGIYFSSSGGTLTIGDGTTISVNEARLYGGGVYVNGTANTFTMNGGTISDCTATDRGGGVYIKSGGTFEMSGTAKITGCKTTSTYDGKGGGGVYVENGTFTMNGGTISKCTAERHGGGIYNNGGTVTMEKDSTISGNSVSDKGGGVYVSDGTFNMTGGTISGNKAENSDGGGVYVFTESSFTMSGGKIGGDGEENANKAKYGGGVYVMKNATEAAMTGGEIFGNIASEQGGGVYVNSAEFKISGTAKISGNTADTSGGGIYIYKKPMASSATLTMTGGEISENVADEKGGGVYNQGGTLTMSGTAKISKNKAKKGTYDGDGGGVYSQNGDFTMSDTAEISENNAGYNSGGVYVDGGKFTMKDNANIYKNIASYGGGVYVSGSFNMIAGTISYNEAKSNGGGVYVYGQSFKMTNGEISNNKAVYKGAGVILRNSSTFIITGGKISGNEITSYTNSDNLNGGGGVYLEGGTFEMSGGAISGNKITGSGKGKGAYISDTFNMSGNARFNTDDDVYLVDLNKIHIGKLEAENPVVATITPYKYQTNRQVLSADDEKTMQDNYNKFAVTPEANGTNWKIVPYESDKKSGVLKQDNVSTGGGGIPVTLPEFGETYTIVIESNGNPIVKNSEIISGNDIILVSVTDPKGTSVNGTVTIELKDEGGTTILKSNDSNSKTLHVPKYTFEMQAQVYVKVELSNPIRVIPETIPVTIKPNSTS
ncbi:MAG: hypothetical protein K2N58_03370 [Treponemataceae bacterium]|nr:hypothetical protein [Treponemataceae bacterium]